MQLLRNIFIIILFLIFSQFTFSSPPISFVVPAGEEGLKRFQQWYLIIKYLSDKSGLLINFEIIKDYLTIQNGINNKIYDAAFVDPVSYLSLRDKNLCDPLVRVVIHQHDTCSSLLIVHKDSIINSISDLNGKNIGLLMPYNSASGYYIPMVLLYENNIVTADYKYFVFTDTFESILKGILYGKLDGGFISSNMLLDTKNDLQLKEVRMILESIPIPQDTVIVRKDLQESTIAALRTLFLDIHNSESGKDALLQAGFDKFILAKDKDYQILKKYLDTIGNNFVSKN